MILATEKLRAAVLNARAAVLNAEVQGMIAENQHCLSCGNSVAYGKDSFDDAIASSGLGENAIVNVAINGEI